MACNYQKCLKAAKVNAVRENVVTKALKNPWKKHLKESVEKVKNMDFEIAVPAHGKPSDDPTDDIDHMMKRIQEFEERLFEILKQPHSVEEAAFKLAEHFSLEFPNGFFYLFRSFVSSLIQDMEKDLQEDGGRWKRI